MKQIKPVGQQAASRKYDLLTALGSHACQGDKNLQRLVLRFITLIVARYNWQLDEISTGQREIAQLWGVDERTVKRDLLKLRSLGWLVQKRAAARGRVAVHGLDLTAILQATRSTWGNVGPDFVERMQGAPAPSPGNVVAFPAGRGAGGASLPLPDQPLPEPVSGWDRAQRRLQAEDAALFDSWFRALWLEQAGPEVVLRAPSKFHASFVQTHYRARLQHALQREGLAGEGVAVLGPAG